MKAQCHICRSWNEVPALLTMPPRWRYSRADGATVNYLQAAEGRLLMEVWRNIEYDHNHIAVPTDWYWQYHPINKCCGQLPGGNAGTKDAAMAAAITAFSDHCSQNNCTIVQLQASRKDAGHGQ